MSDSPLRIQITFPLKDWENCGRCFENNQNFCKRKINEGILKLNMMTQMQRFNSEINEHVRLYRLCLSFLILSDKYRAIITSLINTKQAIVFEMSFGRESVYKGFYNELKKLFESYNLENVTKTNY